MRTVIAALFAFLTALAFHAPAVAKSNCDKGSSACSTKVKAKAYSKKYRAKAKWKYAKKKKYKKRYTKKRYSKKRYAKKYKKRYRKYAKKRTYKKRKYAYRSSGKGYARTGIASFYWQPQALASGGRFNPNALTAAHKTLPFGTLVRVTHLRNGRSVTVRINDRGPYIKGRIIDLSRRAAGVIKMRGQGIARVRIEVVGRSKKRRG